MTRVTSLRRLWSTLLCGTALAAVMSGPGLAQPPIRIIVDGSVQSLSPPPVVIGGRVFVPLRGLFEQMGALVQWKPVSRTVIILRRNITVELRTRDGMVTVNGSPVATGQPPRVIGGRVFIPLRVVSEAIGGRVVWREADRTVVMTSGPGGPVRGAVVVAVSALVYAVGQPVVVTVSNGTAARIFTQDSKTDCSVVDLEQRTATGWHRIPGCRLGRPPLIVDLAPGERLTATLDPKSLHVRTDGGLGFAAGEYRIRFSFTLVRGLPQVEPEVVWSDEFRIR